MFYRDNAALLYLFSHVSSCFHDRTSDNPHMLHSNKTSQFLLLASLPWQPDSFLEPTFLLAYIPQSRGRRPVYWCPDKILCCGRSIWWHWSYLSRWGSETMIDFYPVPYIGDQLMWTSPMLPYLQTACHWHRGSQQ